MFNIDLYCIHTENIPRLVDISYEHIISVLHISNVTRNV